MQVSRELEAGVDVLLHLGEDAGHKLGERELPREGSLNQSHKIYRITYLKQFPVASHTQ